MFPLVPLLLAVAFLWAAVAKTFKPAAWRRALLGYRVPAPLAAPALVLVPLLELGTAALLVAGGDASRAGAAFSVALLAAFSLAVVRARRLQGDRLPCGCFGGHRERDYRLLLVRNAFLGSVAAAILLVPRVVSYELGAPPVSQLLPALLVAVGLVLVALLVTTLTRGLGR